MTKTKKDQIIKSIEPVVIDRVLTFKNPTEVLTLDELKLTESDQTAERAHYEFIEDVMSICDDAKIKTSLGDIFVNKYTSKANPGAIALKSRTDQYGKGHIKTWLLRRALTLLTFTDYVHNDMRYTIALNYLQDGFQIALGMNVNVCSNMCIYGGNIMETYGKGRGNNIEYATLLDHVKGWINGLKEKHDEDLNIINTLKETEFNHKNIRAYFGGLMENAIIGNNSGEFYHYSEQEVKDFQREYLKKIDFDLSLAEEKIPTLWEFYNLGTSVLSMNKTDPRRILNSNNKFSNSIIKEFTPLAIEV